MTKKRGDLIAIQHESTKATAEVTNRQFVKVWKDRGWTPVETGSEGPAEVEGTPELPVSVSEENRSEGETVTPRTARREQKEK